MAYKREKTGNGTYRTYNTKNSVSTTSYSTGGKGSPKTTFTQKSNGVSYTTTTTNSGGYITKTRSNYYNPKTQFKPPKIKNTTVKIKQAHYKAPKVKTFRSTRTRSKPMSFRYTPQLLFLSIILLLIAYILELLGFK